jgi:hypothetical protein
MELSTCLTQEILKWQLYKLSKRILTLAWIEPGQTHQWKWNNAKPREAVWSAQGVFYP